MLKLSNEDLDKRTLLMPIMILDSLFPGSPYTWRAVIRLRVFVKLVTLLLTLLVAFSIALGAYVMVVFLLLGELSLFAKIAGAIFLGIVVYVILKMLQSCSKLLHSFVRGYPSGWRG